jgi:8-oxo-dGTP pyrophosphatase MutT (NUDIX family)
VTDRPGFGLRHPALALLLGEHQPAASQELAWANGTLPLHGSAYTNLAPLPEEIVTSVRCIVLVDGFIVFCQNRDGSHAWPGGRRQPGESYLDMAAREVQEETGWLIEPESAMQLGWLHLTHLGPRPSDERQQLPFPDFLQVVFCAKALERVGGRDAQWTDSEDYELTSRLVTLDDALRDTSSDLLARVFLEVLVGKLARGEIAGRLAFYRILRLWAQANV